MEIGENGGFKQRLHEGQRARGPRDCTPQGHGIETPLGFLVLHPTLLSRGSLPPLSRQCFVKDFVHRVAPGLFLLSSSRRRFDR